MIEDALNNYRLDRFRELSCHVIASECPPPKHRRMYKFLKQYPYRMEALDIRFREAVTPDGPQARVRLYRVYDYCDVEITMGLTERHHAIWREGHARLEPEGRQMRLEYMPFWNYDCSPAFERKLRDRGEKHRGSDEVHTALSVYWLLRHGAVWAFEASGNMIELDREFVVEKLMAD